MKKIIKWLLTEPREDNLFFAYIKKTSIMISSQIHDRRWLGHGWDYPRTIKGDIRQCSKCGRKEWLHCKIIRVKQWRQLQPK